MAGWNLKIGEYDKRKLADDDVWAIFNFIFSAKSKNTSSYKFGLIKAILDNLFNTGASKEYYISFDDLFAKFAENYWNLIVKYHLVQKRADSRSKISSIEIIFNKVIEKEPLLRETTFENLDSKDRGNIIKKVKAECKKYVIGALFVDSKKTFYSFDLKEEGLYLNPDIYNFLLRHKSEIEKLNYYTWARFLEEINDDAVLLRVLDKLNLSTQRTNLNLYRIFLQEELAQTTCFYCGKTLTDNDIHVDHFVPWSFAKDDKLWNLVLTCSNCNLKKSDSLPSESYLDLMKVRNENLYSFELEKSSVFSDCEGYSHDQLFKMWDAARYTGLDIKFEK